MGIDCRERERWEVDAWGASPPQAWDDKRGGSVPEQPEAGGRPTLSRRQEGGSKQQAQGSMLSRAFPSGRGDSGREVRGGTGLLPSPFCWSIGPYLGQPGSGLQEGHFYATGHFPNLSPSGHLKMTSSHIPHLGSPNDLK